MSKTSALITINDITEGIMAMTDVPEEYGFRVEQLVIDAVKELNLLVLDEGRVVEKKTMDSNYLLAMPSDLIRLNGACIPVNGELWPLTVERKIVPTTSLTDGAITLDSDDGEGVDLVKEGTGFASRGGVNLHGYVFPDYAKRRFVFRNVNRSEVLLDYKTSGIELTEVTYVPTHAKPAINAYVRLYLEMNKLKPNFEIAYGFRDEYERQKDICRGVKFNMYEFLDAMYRTMIPTIGRL